MKTSVLWLLFWFGFLGVTTNAFAQTPGEVVKDFYQLGNEGKYSETEKYMSQEVLAALKSELAVAMGTQRKIWQKHTRNGTIEQVEVLKEEIEGDNATVFFRITFKDKDVIEDAEDLIKQGGSWKITDDPKRKTQRVLRRAEINAKQFLYAVQTNDFQTIFNLHSGYQETVQAIRDKNPKVLWTKLTKQYFEEEQKDFNTDKEGWADPSLGLKALKRLFKFSQKWEVTETKMGKMKHDIIKEHDVVCVYTSVEYLDPAQSPVVDQNNSRKRLKSALVQMNFNPQSGLYEGSWRLEAGDVYWEISTSTAAGTPTNALQQPAIASQRAADSTTPVNDPGGSGRKPEVATAPEAVIKPPVPPLVNPEQLLKDCLTFSKTSGSRTATTKFDLRVFTSKYKGRRFRFSGEVEKINESTGTIVFKPVGRGENRGTVEAIAADMKELSGGVIQSKTVVTVEGIVNSFAFGKTPLIGNTPQIITMTDAVIVKP